MVIYFSGTGNSKYCAEFIASKIEDETIDSFNFIKNGIAGEFISGKPYVFVAPTYCWQLPPVFEDFIETANFDGSNDAYFVLTCGSDIGNAQAGIKNLCDSKGFNYRGVMEVVMPENYIAMFRVPGEIEARRIIRAAARPLRKAVRALEADRDFKSPKVNPLDKLKSGPVNPAFYKLFVKAKPFYVTDACIDCGKCSEVCVMNNIELKDGKPVWGDKCTHCMACINRCPAKAIEYGKKSLGKPRYKCVDYVDSSANTIE